MITKSSLSTMLMLGLIAVFAVVLFLPVDAFADTTGGVALKAQTTRLGEQVATIPKLIALGSYVIGAFFAVRALFALKGFIEDPDDNPLTKVLGFAAVSSLLILLPYIIGVMQATIADNSTSQKVTSSSSAFTDTGSF